MFIRIKKIKGGEYAYLVENTWKRKTSRQTVKEYLGKVVHLTEHEIPFTESIEALPFREAALRIIHWQLERCGFVNGENHPDYRYNKEQHQITSKRTGKTVVLKSHDGYLSKPSIEHLISYIPVGTEEEIAYDLARAFVECGIHLEHELFVQLFEKVYDVKKAMHR